MTTGQKIKEARKNAGMTQEELANKLGISYVGISQWERDVRNPKKETLQKLADALGIDISELTEDNISSSVNQREEYSKIVLGHELQKKREKLGLSQEELATQLQIDFVTLQKYELGILFPSRSVRSKLKELGIDLSEIEYGFDINPMMTLIRPSRENLLNNEDVLTKHESKLLRLFVMLNQLGQEKLIDFATILVQVSKFCEKED